MQSELEDARLATEETSRSHGWELGTTRATKITINIYQARER